MISDEQAAFLRERLSEDAAAAVAATPGPWEFEGDDLTDDELWTVHDGEHGDLVGQIIAFTRHRPVANGEHMARWDPVRVVAEVEIWRRLLLEYRTAGLDAKYAGTERETGFQLALSFALKCKAMAYSDHPDYGRLFG